MRRVCLMVCFTLSAAIQVVGQNALAGKTLYTLPCLNAGISIPLYGEVPKDHFRMGAALEGLKVGIWHHSSNGLGFMLEGAVAYYEGFELNYRQWVREQLRSWSVKGNSSMVSPQIQGALTYFLARSQRFLLFASTGVVYKLRRWRASQEHYIPEGYTTYSVSSDLQPDGHLIHSLWNTSVRQVSPFVHGRFGLNFVRRGRILSVFKAWCDVFPPFKFEYKTIQLHEGEWLENTMTIRSEAYGTVGVGVEFYGILDKMFDSD